MARKPKSYITIDLISEFDPRKSMVWAVRTVDGNQLLGVISWKNTWRRYAFFPTSETCYEERCLREIADRCEVQTASRRKFNATMREIGEIK